MRGDKDDDTDASTSGDVDSDNDLSNDNGDAYNDGDNCNGDFYHASEGISDTCDQNGSDEHMNINSDGGAADHDGNCKNSADGQVGVAAHKNVKSVSEAKVDASKISSVQGDYSGSGIQKKYNFMLVRCPPLRKSSQKKLS